ncbi:hypothetical protein [Streptomyces broussonetiae]|uniref:Nuclear transport factor 2 family protein n=1 Tax=Streptomyces broussonetiae TaxID=2686304 RepID=A0A6I6MTX7_9ACTN|nr:hypothetical protein [Streptomyces broussonetiae]QHA03783.1 hypothetical protein GQF42_11300 [Streptomyces broussonetiae]
MPWTPWTRRTLTALTVCVLLPLAATGCASGHAQQGLQSPSPVGKVLGNTDGAGRHLREVDRKDAPEVEVEVTADARGSWDVRLTFRHFRCSAPGAGRGAVTGRGLAYLFVDGREAARLRSPDYRLPGRLVPHGTHHVTARLYADDGTAWAVHGRPVQSTADITVSDTEPPQPPAPSSTPTSGATPARSPGAAVGPTMAGSPVR